MAQAFDHGSFRNHDLSGKSSIIQELDENGDEEQKNHDQHDTESRGNSNIF